MKRILLPVIMLLGVIVFAWPTPSRAAAKGGNPLDALQTQINDLQARITNLETQLSALQNGPGGIAALENRVSAIENNSVLELNGYLTLSTDPSGYKRALFTEINVQIVSGNGTTDGTTNGLGNLIVGYNEIYEDNPNIHTGSHNIISGIYNNYSSYGDWSLGLEMKFPGSIPA